MMTLSSFSRRLLAGVLLFLLVLASLFGLWRRDLARRERETALERRLAVMVREILDVVEKNRRLLEGLRFVDPALRSAAAAASFSTMPFLALTDDEGVIVESYRGWLAEGMSLPKGLVTTSLSVTPLLSPDGHPLVVLAQPLGRGSWLIGGFAPRHLFSPGDLLREGEWSLLLSPEGQVLVALGETRLFPFGVTLPSALTEVPQSTRSWAGVSQRFLVLPLPGQSLTVAVGYPEALIWREALQKGLAAGGALLLGAFSVLLVVFPLFSSVLRSLGGLSASLVRSGELLAGAPDPMEAMETLRTLGATKRPKTAFVELEAIGQAFDGLIEVVAREGEELAGLYEEATAMEENLADTNRHLTDVMGRLNALLRLSQETQGAGDLDGAAQAVTAELCRLFGSPFAAVVAFEEGEPLLWSWSGRQELQEVFLRDLSASPADAFFRSGPLSWEGTRLFLFSLKSLQRLVGGVAVALPPGGDDESLEGVMEPLRPHLAGLLHSREMLGEVRMAYHDVALRMQALTEVYHEETGAHLGRIGEYAAFLGSRLGLDREFVKDLRAFSQLHDLGKLKVPMEILAKPSALTEAEFEVMKNHALWGAQILGDSPWFAMARKICLSHHERWCGGGYPQGLSGEAIPLEGRIVALCDVYDALRSRRSYKVPFSHDRAMTILLEGDGRVMPDHFDPRLLEIVRKEGAALAAIFDSFPEEES